VVDCSALCGCLLFHLPGNSRKGLCSNNRNECVVQRAVAYIRGATKLGKIFGLCFCQCLGCGGFVFSWQSMPPGLNVCFAVQHFGRWHKQNCRRFSTNEIRRLCHPSWVLAPVLGSEKHLHCFLAWLPLEREHVPLSSVKPKPSATDVIQPGKSRRFL